MAKCGYCHQEMLTANGCTVESLLLDGKRYLRIKVGASGDAAEKITIASQADDYRCCDCGAKWGHYHHLGCDMETCPKCGGLLLACDCECQKG